MKAAIHRMIDIFEHHFAVTVLMTMYFGGAFMLAHYGLYEEMSRWIENSPAFVAMIAILKAVEGVASAISTMPTKETEIKP